MIETLERIYKNTKNEAYLTSAVKKKWITAEQKNEIVGVV